VVVGAGPAGARAAYRLAGAGWSVSLLDHRYPWEKPCGGGLNARALTLLRRTLPDLPPSPDRRCLRLDSSGGRTLEMAIDTPFAVLPRLELQRRMVERAQTAGASLVRRRFRNARRSLDRGPWVIDVHGSPPMEADLLVGADGALSAVRRAVAGPESWRDVRPAVGLVHFFERPTRPADGMRLVFTDEPPGYIWEFPGDGFATVGISLPFDPREGTLARSLLHRHLERRGWTGNGPGNGIPRLRGAIAPSAAAEHWLRGPLQGDGWALLGDAAGLVDPLTGEGIYYALRSADLLAEALAAGDPDRYTGDVRRELGRELLLAAHYVKRFFHGGFPDQMLTLASRHESVRRVLGDLICGRQSYEDLKQTLLRSCIPAALRYLLLKLTGRW
jgi:flavin-dependent dehydrogenase